MVSSCHNFSTSTLVPPLGTLFNIISHFSDHLPYLPNTPQYSRQIYQKECSSLRSPSNTVYPGWTALPVPGPSIISMDNNPNWENTPATNSNINLTSNRPTSSTRSWSKLHQSNNNEQLADILGQLANILNANQTPKPNTNSRETKAYISDTFSSTEPDKLNNFLFQCCLYFHANPVQFNIDIAKINFIMTYLTKIA